LKICIFQLKLFRNPKLQIDDTSSKISSNEEPYSMFERLFSTFQDLMHLYAENFKNVQEYGFLLPSIYH